MSQRTYGTVTIEQADEFDLPGAETMLRFDVEPHVAIRLKRIFKQTRQRRGIVTLSANPATLVDVDWFLQRYPLNVIREGGNGRKWLRERADAEQARMNELHQILEGGIRPDPVKMRLPAREYQLVAAHALKTSRNLLLGDELGLGKTVTALAAIAATDALPVLVVVPPHLQRQWKAEVHRFLPALRVHIIRKKAVYDLVTDVIICSYFRLDGWRDHLAGKVRMVVFDECQELRRSGTQKYGACEHVAEKAEYRLGLSATPIYNYGNEFWNVLNVLSPNTLGTRTEFVNEWCLDSYHQGKERLRDPKAFGSFLREQGLMVRRTRAMVARELPGLTRIQEQVECDTDPLKDVQPQAIELAKRIMDRQGTPFELMKASEEFSNMTRLATGLAKARAVAEFVTLLSRESQEPILLFGWHRAVYAAWGDIFDRAELKVGWHTGTESIAQKQKHVEAFTKGRLDVLVMSLRSGQGVDGLQRSCSRVVIGELDWSPGVIEQCIGRIHRDGQESPVLAYYLTTTEGADPAMVDVLGVKGSQIRGVREPFGGEEEVKEADPEHVKKLAASYLKRAGIKVQPATQNQEALL